MPDIKILIIEDEPKVAAFIKKGLEEHGYLPVVAEDGLSGKNLILTGNFELIILDINIPVINGFELCRQIRDKHVNTPVLMLTAMGATKNKISGFEAGADDYLVKPFEFQELVLRIRALLKRTNPLAPATNLLRVADLEINTDTKTVSRGEKKITLTTKEFLLLEYFIRNKGRVLSRMEIAEKIWDITFDTGTNIIDVYINFLRKKIDNDFPLKLIHTKIGMGYFLKDD